MLGTRLRRTRKKILEETNGMSKYDDLLDYIALLRGINVGNSVKINMKELKTLFEQCGFSNVSTYINSGNVIFKSNDKKSSITENIESFSNTLNDTYCIIKSINSEEY